MTEHRTAALIGHAQRPQEELAFWAYSLGSYRHVLAMLGFNIARVTTDMFNYRGGAGFVPRHAIVAERGPAVFVPEIDEQAVAIVNLQTLLAAKEAQLSASEAQLAASEAQRATSEAQLATSEARRAATAAQLCAKVAQSALTEAQLSARDAQLEAMHSSRSWRMTAPLRRLRSAMV